MIKIQEGEMNYKTLDELAFYFMFIGSCLEPEKREELKTEWERQGGIETQAWWRFIMNNTKVDIDIVK